MCRDAAKPDDVDEAEEHREEVRVVLGEFFQQTDDRSEVDDAGEHPPQIARVERDRNAEEGRPTAQ